MARQRKKSNKSPAKAFVSCSLRLEDRAAIETVEAILKAYGFKPGGTVGRHEQAPEAVAISMKDQIAKHECVVVVATRRYLQEDVRGSESHFGLSEMIHAEAGMGYALGLPVLVFVEKGVDVGGFLKDVTQYLYIPTSKAELNSMATQLNAYCKAAWAKIDKRRNDVFWAGLGKAAGLGLAIFGGLSLLSGGSSSPGDEDDGYYDEDYL